MGRLKLSPADFWSMTLPELNAAMSAHAVPVPDTVDRNWLNTALRAHPDPVALEEMGEQT